MVAEELPSTWWTSEGLRDVAREIVEASREERRDGGGDGDDGDDGGAAARALTATADGEAARPGLRLDDLRLDLRVVNHGCGSDNPLERVRFFDHKEAWPRAPAAAAAEPWAEGGDDDGRAPRGGGRGDTAEEEKDGGAAEDAAALLQRLPRAQRAPAASSLASLPREFQEISLRAFVTSRSPGALARSRGAFGRWCGLRQLCEGGRCEIAPVEGTWPD